MDESFIILAKFSSIVILVLMNAFFVAAEFSLVSIRRTRVEELITAGNRGARPVQNAIHDPDRFIAATQLGVTVASLGIGWVAEPALRDVIQPIFQFVPANLSSVGVDAAVAGIVAFLIVTFLTVVVGELSPKSIALAYTEQIALFVARPILIFETMFRPVIWALNAMASALLKLIGLDRPAGHQLVHSVDELKMLVTASAASGALEPSEKEMLHNVFEFNDRLVREVMIPRPDMIAFEENTTIDEFLQAFMETSHARFPIYSKTIDNITGFIAIKDVLRTFSSGGPEVRKQPVRSLARPTTFVPESKRIGSLFTEMQAQKAQLAIIIDEFGGTAGMVTMEELIEEIVGQLGDELAQETPLAEKIDEHSAQFDGLIRVEEVNEAMGIHLPESEDYETIAGFVLYALHHVPQEGEQFRTDNVRITVTRMTGPKIEQVLITRV